MTAVHNRARKGYMLLATAVLCLLATHPAVPNEFRQWTNSTGTRSIEAALVAQDESTALVRQRDGERIRLSIERLSREDREYLRQKRPMPSAPPPADGTEQAPLDRERLTARIDPAVVHVSTERTRGSGFFVGPQQVITNFHVVEGADSAIVETGGRTFAVKGYYACAPHHDLVLLMVERPAGPALPLATELPGQFDEVVAFGSARGLENAATRNRVRAVRSFHDVRAGMGDGELLRLDDDTTLIQMTMEVSRGCSGGPLVNHFGQVVGVNTPVRRDARSVNFAVALCHVQELLEEGEGARVTNLVSLPRRLFPGLPGGLARPEPVRRTLPLEVTLRNGRVVALDTLTVPSRELRGFFRGGTPALEVEVPEVGTVGSGIVWRAGPQTFGLPEGFVFIWREGAQPVLAAGHARAITEVVPRDVSLDNLAGIIGFNSGRIHGHASLFDGMPVYCGRWTAGEPAPSGMFLVEASSQLGAVVLRSSGGQVSSMTLIRDGQVAEELDTFDRIMAHVEGKTILESLRQREDELKDIAATIAEPVQEEAKDIQREIIANRQRVTRESIARRINQRRAENDAAVGGRMGAGIRRGGL